MKIPLWCNFWITKEQDILTQCYKEMPSLSPITFVVCHVQSMTRHWKVWYHDLQSPDLNPPEYLWMTLEKCFRNHQNSIWENVFWNYWKWYYLQRASASLENLYQGALKLFWRSVLDKSTTPYIFFNGLYKHNYSLKLSPVWLGQLMLWKNNKSYPDFKQILHLHTPKLTVHIHVI